MRGWLVCFMWFAVAQAEVQVTPLDLPGDLPGDLLDVTLSPDGKTLAFGSCKPDASCAIYTRALDGGPVHPIVENIEQNQKRGIPGSLQFSPDGKRIAFTRNYSRWDVHLIVRTASPGDERDFGTVCDGASWSPDGRFLVAAQQFHDTECRPVVYDTGTGRVLRTLAPKGEGPALSPNGRMLAYSVGPNLRLLSLTKDLRPAAPPVTLDRSPRDVERICWTEDSASIVYDLSGDSNLWRRIAAHAGAKPQALLGVPGDVSIMSVLANGTAIGIERGTDNGLWRLDLKSAKPTLEKVENSACFPGAWWCSPDGRFQFVVKAPQGFAQIWISNADGSNERVLVKSIPRFSDPDDDAFPMPVGFSPNGKWLAFSTLPARGNADLRSHLYVAPVAGGPPKRLGREAFSLYNAVWSHDGKSLYAIQNWDPDDPKSPAVHGLVRIDLASGKVTPLGDSGMWPQLSPDGQFLYYFSFPRRPGLHRIRLVDGTDEQLWQGLSASYAVGSAFIYLFQQTAEGQAFLRFDPAKRETTSLGTIPFRPKTARLSASERYLYIEQQEQRKPRAVIVRGLCPR